MNSLCCTLQVQRDAVLHDYLSGCVSNLYKYMGGNDKVLWHLFLFVSLFQGDPRIYVSLCQSSEVLRVLTFYTFLHTCIACTAQREHAI